eukprot:4570092-Pleurochrysis_carterae.AAC.1
MSTGQEAHCYEVEGFEARGFYLFKARSARRFIVDCRMRPYGLSPSTMKRACRAVATFAQQVRSPGPTKAPVAFCSWYSRTGSIGDSNVRVVLPPSLTVITDAATSMQTSPEFQSYGDFRAHVISVGPVFRSAAGFLAHLWPVSSKSTTPTKEITKETMKPTPTSLAAKALSPSSSISAKHLNDFESIAAEDPNQLLSFDPRSELMLVLRESSVQPAIGSFNFASLPEGKIGGSTVLSLSKIPHRLKPVPCDHARDGDFASVSSAKPPSAVTMR